MSNSQFLQKANEYIAAEQHPQFKQEIVDLVAKSNVDELHDRFYTSLEFGTGGMRGVIGGGYNRMNPLVIARTTQGLANYIKKASASADPSAVIAYDSRRFSELFALEAALVLCANGIRTYLYTSLRSTPQLSFSVRHLGATAGIVVTASHNPPQYNGYKVYWNDGAQIVAPHDTAIVSEVLSMLDSGVKRMTRDEAIAKKLLVMIDKDVDDAFIAMVKRQAIRPELLRQHGKSVKVVFTPLHGTGAMPVSRALSEMGLDVIFVPEQREPDGNFPTVKFPNPEEASAMQMAIDLAKKNDADLVMGTDPDADRMGIAVKNGTDYTLVTGNQLGVLLADYIFSGKKELGTLPKKPAFVKTIVTTDLQRRVAESFGAIWFDVLTGFKFIGEKIREFDLNPDGPQYVFGGEESYGYLVETDVRDKDAVTAATLTAEMALYHRVRGSSLLGRLNEIYKQFGYFEETQISKNFAGSEGVEAIKNLMNKLRSNPPSSFGDQKVVLVKDYQDGTTTTIATQSKAKNINLPSSNVIQLLLESGDLVTARPSGTEPKIKFYASCCSEAGQELVVAKKFVAGKIAVIKESVNSLL